MRRGWPGRREQSAPGEMPCTRLGSVTLRDPGAEVHPSKKRSVLQHCLPFPELRHPHRLQRKSPGSQPGSAGCGCLAARWTHPLLPFSRLG